MIGRISGKILEMSEDFVLVDVRGVAYEIEIPQTTYLQLQQISDDVTLHTHMIVREDAQLLYGFYSEQERTLFRSLIKVNKVGPKVAIAILSNVETSEFVRCVQDKDAKTLNTIPGVGKVMAERLIVEMGNKLSQWQLPVATGKQLIASNFLADAESALVQLGYKPQEAARALALLADPGADVETLIKQALKSLG